ncbi:TPA: hypothetical protein QCI71_003159 [Enterobacter chuandaensis]|uniref:hypothetical protein n=1 Tax=Enterobacter nematophilus TaxID=2994648 RepID=UPI0032F3A616|nr:hypothetical protein [Enterobacter chuandaensis]
MKYKWVLIVTTLGLPFVSNATEIPTLGGIRAESHQICGKNIDVEIIRLDNNSTLLGLKNNQTHNIDLFLSPDQGTDELSYAKFTPARYDELSKNYIPQNDPELEVVWGSARDDNKQLIYTLALGPQVYNCTKLQKWPSVKANIMYGDVAEG